MGRGRGGAREGLLGGWDELGRGYAGSRRLHVGKESLWEEFYFDVESRVWKTHWKIGPADISK